MGNPSVAFVVRELETDREVRRYDVTGLSPRVLTEVEEDLMAVLDADLCWLDTSEVDTQARRQVLIEGAE